MLKSSIIALQGTLFAQAIGFLFIPILTRLYTPEAFGAYQLYMSLLMLILVAASLRYEVALLGAKNGGEERAVFRLCLALNALCFVIVLAIAACLVQLTPAWLYVPSAVLWLLSAGVLTGGLLQTVGYVLLREQALGINSLGKILQILVFCLSGIFAAHAGQSELGLIGADVVSRAAAVALIVAWMASQRSSIFLLVSANQVRASGWRFREYPMLAVPGGFVSVGISSMVPVLMLVAFGDTTMGQYTLVERTIIAPSGLIGHAVAQAFSAHLSVLQQHGKNARSAFRLVTIVMFAIGLCPAILLMTYGPWFFMKVFGEQWSLAGEFAQILSIVFLSGLVMAPVNMTLLITGRQGVQFAWEFSRLILVGAIWVIVVYCAIAPINAIFLHACGLVAMSIVFICLADRALRGS